MKIGPLSNHQAPDPKRSSEKPLKEQAPTKDGKREDRVDISNDARRRLAEQADSARLQELREQAGGTEGTVVASDESTLQNGRLEQIRLKILSGFYDSPEVVDRIADRLTDDLADE